MAIIIFVLNLIANIFSCICNDNKFWFYILLFITALCDIGIIVNIRLAFKMKKSIFYMNAISISTCVGLIRTGVIIYQIIIILDSNIDNKFLVILGLIFAGLLFWIRIIMLSQNLNKFKEEINEQLDQKIAETYQAPLNEEN